MNLAGNLLGLLEGGFAGLEARAKLLTGHPFTAIRLGAALFEAGDNGRATGGEIDPLSCQQVKGLVEEVSRSSVASGGELLLDAGFGGGIEDEAHGRKYNAGAGDGEPVRAASGGVRACPGECGGDGHLLLSRLRVRAYVCPGRRGRCGG